MKWLNSCLPLTIDDDTLQRGLSLVADAVNDVAEII